MDFIHQSQRRDVWELAGAHLARPRCGKAVVKSFSPLFASCDNPARTISIAPALLPLRFFTTRMPNYAEVVLHLLYPTAAGVNPRGALPLSHYSSKTTQALTDNRLPTSSNQRRILISYPTATELIRLPPFALGGGSVEDTHHPLGPRGA